MWKNVENLSPFFLKSIGNQYTLDYETTCSRCLKKKLFYCASCNIITNESLKNNFQTLKLPLNVLILFSKAEKRKKSTVYFLSALESPQIEIVNFSNPAKATIDPETDIVVYMNSTSKCLSELDISNKKRVVFFDTTWADAKKQTSTIFSGVQCYHLNNYHTTFWRYNDKSCYDVRFGLSTIEALFYFFGELYINKKLNWENADENLKKLIALYSVQFKLICESKDVKNAYEVTLKKNNTLN